MDEVNTKHLDMMQRRLIDQIDRTKKIGLVVEMPDKMAQPLSRIRGQMVHVVKVAVSPQPGHPRRIDY